MDPEAAVTLKPTRRQPRGEARKQIKIRMSDDEIADLKARAEKAEMDASAFIRTAIGQAVIVRDKDAQRVVYLLSTIANNLNQLARHANTHKSEADALDIIMKLRQSDSLIRQAFKLGEPPLLHESPKP